MADKKSELLESLLKGVDASLELRSIQILADPPNALTQFRAPICLDDLPDADDMLIEGVLFAGLSFLGAYAGAGKTTAMVPLVAVVAGLMEVEHLEIMGWRRVIYISEHPEQFEKSLRALATAQNLDLEHLKDRVRVAPAERVDVSELVSAIPKYREFAESHNVNGVTSEFMPWVIADTFAATIQMDNENDNAQASAIISQIKRAFGAENMPITIVAHAAKANKDGEAKSLSVRGAGAFEGDAHQVIYLVNKDGRRSLEIEIPKHRFDAKVSRLNLAYDRIQMQQRDRFKRLVARYVGYCTLEPVTRADEHRARENAEALLANEMRKTIVDVAGRILEEYERDRELVTRNSIFERMKKMGKGFNKADVLREIEKLIKEKVLRVESITPEVRARLKSNGWKVNNRLKDHINYAGRLSGPLVLEMSELAKESQM